MMTAMKKLAGKTALVTGGNSGIGLATARLFVNEGARVAISGRDAASLDRAATELGPDTMALQSDASRVSEIEQLMRQVGERFGKLDVLVLNAAAGQPMPMEFITEEAFDAMSGVCFKGVFFAIQKALPLLHAGSAVIVTTSIANQVAAPGFGVYAAAKAAARSLVRTAAVELAPRGIRVNAISPGPIDTPGFGRWDGVPAEVVQAARDDFSRRSPLQRFGRADEVAQAALFLATEASSYMVGAELVVDGGFSQLF
jgi:NAD(P)-dependent dehydrogenase (short-subunit alcohol dehydrogenase family)